MFTARAVYVKKPKEASPQSSRDEFSIAHMCLDRSTFHEENKGLVKGRSL